MAKSIRLATDIPIELSVEPARSPVSRSSSSWRQFSAVLLATSVIVFGVRAIAPGLSPSGNNSVPIELDDLDTTLTTFFPEHSPDWVELERGPLAARWPAVLSWSGDELVVWGGSAHVGGQALDDGAAYNPATGKWRNMSPSPIGAYTEVAWVWTDSELIIWSGEGSAVAWAPVDNQWREIRDWPLQIGAAIWTGREIVDLRSAVAIDPKTGNVRRIATPPGAGMSSGNVWTGTEILMLADGVAYDPARDTWSVLPDTGPAGISVAGAWTGEFAVAVDYLMNSAAYDPASGSWTPLAEVPLIFSGCAPRVHGSGTSVVADLCGDLGLLSRERSGWLPVSSPVPNQGNTVTVADGELYAWGEGLYHMKPEVLRGISPPRRLTLGVTVLDLPVEWELRSARLESPGRVAIEAVGPSNQSCRAVAIHTVGNRNIGFMGDSNNLSIGQGDFVPGQVKDGLDDLPEDKRRLRWAASDTDVIDIACSDPESARLLASGVLTP